MMKSAVFLLVLVAVVNSDDGDGNFFAAGDKREGTIVAGSADGDYYVVTRDVKESELDPITAMELALPPRMARLSLNVGAITSTCRLLLGMESIVAAIPGMVRTIEINFPRSGNTIRAVEVNPRGTTAASIRLQGGLNTNWATITITSRPHEGFHYNVEIWGGF